MKLFLFILYASARSISESEDCSDTEATYGEITAVFFMREMEDRISTESSIELKVRLRNLRLSAEMVCLTYLNVRLTCFV